jgi:hypothetical protein
MAAQRLLDAVRDSSTESEHAGPESSQNRGERAQQPSRKRRRETKERHDTSEIQDMHAGIEGVTRSWSTRKSSHPTFGLIIKEQETRDGQHCEKPVRPIHISQPQVRHSTQPGSAHQRGMLAERRRLDNHDTSSRSTEKTNKLKLLSGGTA